MVREGLEADPPPEEPAHVDEGVRLALLCLSLEPVAEEEEEEEEVQCTLVSTYRSRLIRVIYGFITKREAAELLRPHGEGTFVIRFSEKNAGQFAIAYVKVRFLFLQAQEQEQVQVLE